MTTDSWVEAGERLSEIARRDNGAIVQDRRRTLGLLRDFLPEETRIIRLLMVAFDGGVPARLRAAAPLSEMTVEQEAQRLVENSGTAKEFAHAAVLAWARAISNYVPAATVAAPTAGISSPTQPEPAPLASVVPLPVQPIPVQPLPVQPIPAAPQPVQPLPVQPIPTAQPLPLPSASSVQPLPMQPAPTAAAAAQPQANKWKILRLVLTGIVAVGAGAKLVDVLTQSRQPTAEQQPSSSAPAPAPTPAPRSSPPTQTAEGVSVITAQEPYPHLHAGRVNNDPNSLLIYFGLPTGNTALSYQVNFVFAKNQQRGQGFAAAFSGNQIASTGTIAADHLWKSETKEMSLLLSGPMATNPFNAPPICIVARVGPRLDRIDIDANSFIGIFGAKGATAGPDSCDLDKSYGFGYLQ